MYVLIRQYTGLDADTRDNAMTKANQELRPLMSKSAGFVSYELIKPVDNDASVTSISVFDTREHAEESNKTAAEWVRSNLPSMPTPKKVAGELVAH